MKVKIRAADPDDLDEVLSILDEAGAWLHAIGITQQWPRSFSGREGTPETFTDQLNAAIVYLARIDGAAVGTFRLTENDARVWPEAKTGEALYLHSLAVRRSVAGSGVATEMLSWARAHAGSLGMQELRLDCWLATTGCAVTTRMPASSSVAREPSSISRAAAFTRHASPSPP